MGKTKNEYKMRISVKNDMSALVYVNTILSVHPHNLCAKRPLYKLCLWYLEGCFFTIVSRSGYKKYGQD